jgi:hypothetical protein
VDTSTAKPSSPSTRQASASPASRLAQISGSLHLESPQHAGTSRLESCSVLFIRLRPCCRCASFCLGNIHDATLRQASRLCATCMRSMPDQQRLGNNPTCLSSHRCLLCTGARTDSRSESPVLAGFALTRLSFFNCCFVLQVSVQSTTMTF